MGVLREEFPDLCRPEAQRGVPDGAVMQLARLAAAPRQILGAGHATCSSLRDLPSLSGRRVKLCVAGCNASQMHSSLKGLGFPVPLRQAFFFGCLESPTRVLLTQ